MVLLIDTRFHPLIDCNTEGTEKVPIGYLAIEFLDGKLVRSEAIKVIEIVNSNKNV